MTQVQPAPLERVALVAAPWPLFNRPSIQLGALKAFLQQQRPWLRVDGHHLYLPVAAAVGYPLYGAISERTWLAECIYAALLFPERSVAIEKLFSHVASGQPQLRHLSFKTLLVQVGTVTRRYIAKTPWDQYGLVGFTIGLCQLTASLFVIQQLKQHAPHLPVVIGGASLDSELIRDLMAVFPQIDFAVHGEGELPLLGLVDGLRKGGGTQRLDAVAGLFARSASGIHGRTGFNQLPRLASLPIPDYDDYFNLLQRLPLAQRFFPILSVEASRGCWWRRPAPSGRSRGCAFCNLNLQWQGYRTKTPAAVIKEIDQLTTRHQVLSVAFMDNALPPQTITPTFQGLTRLNKDLALFGEIRATTRLKDLRAMRQAGVEEVQVGIEALSTDLLKKLNKGTSAIQNVEVMKHCEELGMANSANLIVGFPGSELAHVSETLRVLAFVQHLRPLRVVNFWLGRGSGVWQDPQAFGVQAMFNHPHYRILFPPQLSRGVRFVLQAYRGDRLHQRRLWQPVKAAVRQWARDYERLRPGGRGAPILSYRDGRHFMIIRQKQPGAPPMTHRLEGPSRELYRYCRRHRSLAQLRHRFPRLDSTQLTGFLDMMVGKKLMFEEQRHYLSLAVRLRPG